MTTEDTVVPMPAPSAPDGPPGPGGEHYFSASPTSGSRPDTVRLTLPDLTLDLTTDRGVFSPTRIDPGTKLLLSEIQDRAPDVGRRRRVVVDLGCGYGPIALTLASRHPEDRVLAVDVNGRARALCATNAERLGLEVEVCPPEDVPESLPIDHLVSNPPIRIGKPALQTLLAEWLDRLDEHGRAHLVVRRQLGADSLAAWLLGRGHTVARLRSRQGYRVLEIGPRRPWEIR